MWRPSADLNFDSTHSTGRRLTQLWVIETAALGGVWYRTMYTSLHRTDDRSLQSTHSIQISGTKCDRYRGSILNDVCMIIGAEVPRSPMNPAKVFVIFRSSVAVSLCTRKHFKGYRKLQLRSPGKRSALRRSPPRHLRPQCRLRRSFILVMILGGHGHHISETEPQVLSLEPRSPHTSSPREVSFAEASGSTPRFHPVGRSLPQCPACLLRRQSSLVQALAMMSIFSRRRGRGH